MCRIGLWRNGGLPAVHIAPIRYMPPVIALRFLVYTEYGIHLRLFRVFASISLSNNIAHGRYLCPVHGMLYLEITDRAKYIPYIVFVFKFSTKSHFLPTQKKMDIKYLKTWMKFVLFYSLPKNDVNLQKKTMRPSWRTKTWRAIFFYNSCRTWFIEIIEREGKGKPSSFYWQVQSRHSTHGLVRITFM